MNIINLMLPLILLVLTGLLLSKFEFFNQDSEIFLNKLIFNLSLPAIMVVSINEYGIRNIFDVNFALAYILSIAIPFSASFVFFRLIRKTSILECIFIGMNSSISNSGLIAMPILLSLFGNAGGAPAIALLTISSILIMPFCILCIEFKSVSHHSGKPNIFLSALKKTALQPFILATLMTVILSISMIEVPKWVLTYLQYLGNILIPCALITVGITLSSRKIKNFRVDIYLITFINLVLKPILAIWLAYEFHLSKLYAIALIVVSAAPVANSIYIISAKYHIYKRESAEISFLTIILSLVTLPFFIWVGFKII